MDKVHTFLWFDDQAEEAAKFYTSLFENSRITEVSRYGEAGPGEPGSAMTVSFELDGRPFTALNGGPDYRFTEAISLFVTCEDQAEVDKYWDAFTGEGGEEGPCGWLKDRYGLSWQIIPNRLMELLQDPDRDRADRAMKCMLGQHKIVVAELEAAAG